MLLGKKIIVVQQHILQLISYFALWLWHVFSEYKMDLCNQQHKGIISPNNDNFVP